MGGGIWDVGTYTTKKAHMAGKDPFIYSGATHTKHRSEWKAHKTLDPKTKAGKNSPHAGKNIRESRDNTEHPNSTPIAVIFDNTGSMGNVPRVLQTKLAELFGLLLRKNYIQDPQILVGAYGDAYMDRVPLQIGQFESDNRIDETLENLFLEGGGGGNGGESATLAWYYIGTHTSTDATEKRGKKGYLFTIGDEIALPATPEQIKQHTGDNTENTYTPKQAIQLAQENWHVFHLIINNTTARMQQSPQFYTKLLGDNAIILENEEAAAETIAGIIGMMEGNLTDLDDFEQDLVEIGAEASSRQTATKAIAKLGTKTGKGKAAGTLPDSKNNPPLERP